MTLVKIGDYRVDVLDADCPFRPCYAFGFDKGPYTPGVGYTRPETVPRPVCMTRHLNGCPHVGVHLKCGDCHKVLSGAIAMEEDLADHLLAACPHCGASDLYWLADVVADPSLCCASPSLPKKRAYRQRCRSCGTKLVGRRLALARVAAGLDPV